MSVHMERINVFGSTSFPSLPQIEWPFEPREISVFNEDTADTIAISFDGQSDHTQLISRSAQTFSQRSRKVWLRSVGAGSDPTTVQVVAES